VPVDLYRTVKMSQIHPAVRGLTATQFSAVVPLFCAALTLEEAEDPPFYMNSQGRVLLRGASLSCFCSTKTSSIMPWEDVTNEEPIGESHVPLDNFQNTYSGVGGNPFGILHTSKLYESGPSKLELFDSKKFKDESTKKRSSGILIRASSSRKERI
jgi:hypothetical protein